MSDAAALVRPANLLDVALLEPGDIVMVANPTDMAVVRYLVFWSHVGIVSSQGDVIDAVREPRGEYAPDDVWYQVRRSRWDLYRLSYDILALRPRLPMPARLAAARYAESKVGAPYAPNLRRIAFGRRDETAFSCASLMWQAYQRQGLNLAPARAHLEYNVVPLWLARDPRLATVGRSTRYRPIPATCRRLRLERRWFRHVLGADIFVDGLPD